MVEFIQCRIEVTGVLDTAYLIKRDEFMSCVDPWDLAQRDSSEILDAYHPNWFRKDNEEATYFTPPAFYLTNGIARFINGQHRALVLAKHLEILPMALTESDIASDDVLKRIVNREILANDEVLLPDLPINTTWLDSESA